MSSEAQVVEDAPEEEEDLTEEARVLLAGITPEIQSWLLGETQEQPSSVSSAMDQVAEKINMATAMVVAQRLAHMGRTLSFLRGVEESLLTPERIKKMDAKERMTHYRTLTKDMNEFLEFSRKFTLQNKEMFSKKSQADELAAILRELDPSVVNALLQAVSKKGAGTTVNDLVAPKPQTTRKKRNSVLNELIGDKD